MKKPTAASTPATTSEPDPATTSPDVASIAAELLSIEPIDIVNLGSADGPTVDDFLAKVKAVAGSALRQVG